MTNIERESFFSVVIFEHENKTFLVSCDFDNMYITTGKYECNVQDRKHRISQQAQLLAQADIPLLPLLLLPLSLPLRISLPHSPLLLLPLLVLHLSEYNSINRIFMYHLNDMYILYEVYTKIIQKMQYKKIQNSRKRYGIWNPLHTNKKRCLFQSWFFCQIPFFTHHHPFAATDKMVLFWK